MAESVQTYARFIPACAGNASTMCWRLPTFAGSSPRVRGTLPRPVLPERRFIATAVHPRVCGERALGQRTHGRSARFIPACAGNAAVTAGLSGCCNRFIPACAGNASSAALTDRIDFGSSPRVRGTLDDSSTSRCDKRFIPACAGNAPRRSQLVLDVGSSPRVRGTRRRQHRARSTSGSSPRVRGTHGPTSRALTPCPVHPRVCGERSDSA